MIFNKPLTNASHYSNKILAGNSEYDQSGLGSFAYRICTNAERLVVEEIALLRKSGVVLSEIAIICSTNEECGYWQKILQADGIPAITSRQDLSIHIRILILLLEYQENQNVKVLHALSSSRLFCIDPIENEKNKLLDEEIRLILINAEERSNKTLHGMICLIYESTHPLNRTLTIKENIESYQDGVIFLQQMAQMIQSVENLSSRQSTYLWKKNLIDRLDNPKDPVDELFGNAVQILTVHAIKGLEFTAIFNTYPKNMEREEYGKSYHNKKSEEEIYNALYVSCTRAKNFLYLIEENKKDNKGNDKAYPYNLWSFVPILPHNSINNQRSAAMGHIKNQVDSMEKDVTHDTLNHTEEREGVVSILSYSSMQQQPQQITYLKQEKRSSTKSEIPAREFGVFVHDLLDKIPIDASKLSVYFQIIQKVASFVEENEELLKVTFHIISLSAKMVWSALTSKYIRGSSLKDLYREGAIMQKETLFLYVAEKDGPNKTIHKGIVDLAITIENDVYLVDWKTDLLDSYQKEPLRQHIEAHYKTQVKFYHGAANAVAMKEKKNVAGFVYVFLRGLVDEDGALDIMEEGLMHDK